jgi:hypothetical protein
MKSIHALSLFVLVLLLMACSTQPTPTLTNNELFIEEQEFILSPEVESGNLQTASLTAPRLVVRLSIQPELDKNGNPTGKRYGQAAFFWTDKARSRGGSNLGGTVSIMLRDANISYMDGAEVASSSAPVMTNVDLYKQLDYEDHMVKTLPVSSDSKLCIEVSSINLLSTNGYFFNKSWEMTPDYDTNPSIRLCEKKSAKEGLDLRLSLIRERMTYAASGTEFALSVAVINSGSNVAENVAVSYKIPWAEKLTFIRDASALFECSATTTQTNDEGLVMNVSCYAEKMGVGVRTLPLVFSTTKDAPAYNFLLEFYMNISTSSTETDTTNNQADSFIVLDYVLRQVRPQYHSPTRKLVLP